MADVAEPAEIHALDHPALLEQQGGNQTNLKNGALTVRGSSGADAARSPGSSQGETAWPKCCRARLRRRIGRRIHRLPPRLEHSPADSSYGRKRTPGDELRETGVSP